MENPRTQILTLSKDPTKTAGIERRWLREINRRWGKFAKNIISELKRIEKLTINAADFKLDASRIKIYMNFVQLQIDALLLGSDAPPNWQAAYQLDSYKRALERAQQALIQQGITDFTPAVLPTLQPTDFQAIPALASAGTAQLPGIHRDALEFLYQRSYESLKGATDQFSKELRQILQDGLRDGRGVRETTKLITERIDVSRSRAQLIARTETIQAYQRSHVNEAVRVSEEIDEEVKLRWITRRDGRVRPLHASWHGQTMTTEEGQKRIGQSPWNCRCALTPIIEEADTPAKQKKFDAEREQLLNITN